VEQAGWDWPAALVADAERRGLEFLADFYGAEVLRKPENVEALAELGNVLTRLGRFDEGLAVDRELARREPDDATVRYNLACSLALVGRIDESFQELGQAVANGYEDAEHLAADEDLAAQRGDPRYAALLLALRAAANPGESSAGAE